MVQVYRKSRNCISYIQSFNSSDCYYKYDSIFIQYIIYFDYNCEKFLAVLFIFVIVLSVKIFI